MASGRLILPLSEPALTAAGVPNSGATLTVYNTGTTTLASIYADAALSTPITNPQTSNAAGRFYAQSTEIWADVSIAYDCVLSLTTGEVFTYLNVWLVGAPQSVTGYAPINSPTFTGVPQAPTPAANDSSGKIATTQFVNTAISNTSFIPAGMVAPFAMATPPAGWLVCNGSAISRTTYARLFNVIGTTWGSGDGSTTFNLPDCRGEFVRGADLSRGLDPGRVVGTSQDFAMQGHLHNWNISTTNVSGVSAGIATGGNNNIWQNPVGTTTTAVTSSPVTDGTNGAPKTAAETRPVNVAMTYCIKI
jgi:microcystin-dependent protein